MNIAERVHKNNGIIGKLIFFIFLTALLLWNSIQICFFPKGIHLFKNSAFASCAQPDLYIMQEQTGLHVTGYAHSRATAYTPSGKSQAVLARYCAANYLQQNSLSLLSGRFLSPDDSSSVVIEKRLAHMLFSTTDCIGFSLSVQPDEQTAAQGSYTVVGVYEMPLSILNVLAGEQPPILLPLSSERELDVVQIDTPLTPSALFSQLPLPQANALNAYTAVLLYEDSLFFCNWFSVYLILILLTLFTLFIRWVVAASNGFFPLPLATKVYALTKPIGFLLLTAAILFMLTKIQPSFPFWMPLQDSAMNLPNYWALLQSRMASLGLIDSLIATPLRLLILKSFFSCTVTLISVLFYIFFLYPYFLKCRVFPAAGV